MIQVENKKNINLVIKGNCRKTTINETFMSIVIFYFYVLVAVGMCMTLPKAHIKTALFYNVVIIGAVIFAALAENAKTTFLFNIFFGVSFFILFFILAYRNASGIDDVNYMQIFYEVSQYGWLSKFSVSKIEPGYLLLNALVSTVTNNYLYMQVINSFIPMALFYYAFKRYKDMISLPMAIFLLSTMIYFQMISVALVRIFISISIVFNAYYYIHKQNPKKYVFLILLASMFHYSSLFMLVLTYFAINKNNLLKKTKRFVIIIFVTTPIIFIAISNLIVPLMGNRYAAYGIVNNLEFSISSFDTLPILLLLIFYYKNINKEYDDYYKLFLSIFALSSILSFYSTMVSLGRLIYYTNLGLFLAAPMMCKELNKTSIKKFIFYGIIIIYGFLYIYRTQFTLEFQIPNLFPYKNIFFTV